MHSASADVEPAVADGLNDEFRGKVVDALKTVKDVLIESAEGAEDGVICQSWTGKERFSEDRWKAGVGPESEQREGGKEVRIPLPSWIISRKREHPRY